LRGLLIDIDCIAIDVRRMPASWQQEVEAILKFCRAYAGYLSKRAAIAAMGR
jgi:hypothetical protein